MVQPIEKDRDKSGIRTLEQRLAEKFDELQVAREQKAISGADTYFDEVTKSIVVLLKAVPAASEELDIILKELNKAVSEEENKIYAEIQNAEDQLQYEFLKDQKLNSLRWERRELIEEILMDVMRNYLLIDMKRPPQPTIVSQQPQQEVKEQIPIQKENIEQPEQVQQSLPDKKNMFGFRRQ